MQDIKISTSPTVLKGIMPEIPTCSSSDLSGIFRQWYSTNWLDEGPSMSSFQERQQKRPCKSSAYLTHLYTL